MAAGGVGKPPAMDWMPEWALLARVAVAAVLGTAIGFEREHDGHPAGTRTIATIAVGAALFGAISTRGFDEFAAERAATNVQVDVTRIASQVVVGIGFLGAGVIFRRGGSIQNLTTAATMWATAAIGLAAGVGDVGLATGVAGIVLVLLIVVPRPERWLFERVAPRRRSVHLGLAEGAVLEAVRAELAGIPVEVVGWRVEKAAGRVQLDLVLTGRTEHAIDAAVGVLVASELVDDVRVQG